MTRKSKPTRAERKARTAERHEIVRSIMQEPDDVIHFPVAFGRIAMNAAVWGAIALGILALGVLSSAVFLMRDEIGGLGRQLQQKDTDLNILSSELQKVRDQMFGEQEEMSQQGMRIVTVSTENGLMEELPNPFVAGDDLPILAVAGQYLYQVKEDTVVRRELKTDTEVEILKSSNHIVDLIISNNGEWLAYGAVATETSGVSMRAFVLPLAGRGDPVELGPWPVGLYPGPDIVALSDDGKTIILETFRQDGDSSFEFLRRVNVSNGNETGVVETEYRENSPEKSLVIIGPTPDGSHAIILEQELERYGEVGLTLRPLRLLARNFTTGRDRVLHTFGADDSTDIKAALSLDGSAVVVILDDEVFAVPVTGGEWQSLGKVSLDAQVDETAVAYVPGRFLLTLVPGLAGRYAYRNLETGTIASVDGPFVSVIGVSLGTNSILLLEDTRE